MPDSKPLADKEGKAKALSSMGEWPASLADWEPSAKSDWLGEGNFFVNTAGETQMSLRMSVSTSVSADRTRVLGCICEGSEILQKTNCYPALENMLSHI
jgi:hypothetical protein